MRDIRPVLSSEDVWFWIHFRVYVRVTELSPLDAIFTTCPIVDIFLWLPQVMLVLSIVKVHISNYYCWLSWLPLFSSCAAVAPSLQVRQSAALLLLPVAGNLYGRPYRLYEFDGVVSSGMRFVSKFFEMVPAVLELKHADVWDRRGHSCVGSFLGRSA